jgi:UDP-glucose 6-dehydrogenase
MSKYRCLIVGYGVVGKHLHGELIDLEPDVYDKAGVDSRPYRWKYTDPADPTLEYDHYDVVFICVDTPLLPDNNLDISEVCNVIEEHDANIYVIKSTCPVGTVDMLTQRYSKQIVYSPEYYGATQHCNNIKFDFTILGGDNQTCIAVQQILQHCYDGRHTFTIVDGRTAELAKLMENAWLATKVSFCSQFYQLATYYDIAYEELRELFILDPRVNPSHTFVYSEHPYWSSHCLDKDVPHIANFGRGAEFLQCVVRFNEDVKSNCLMSNTEEQSYDMHEDVPTITCGLDPTTGEWGHNN